MRWWLAGVAIALAAAVPASAAAATRYVEVGGTDAGNCTNPSAPCAHVQFAADQAASGDTVQIAAGTYAESVEVDTVLTFSGAGAGTLSDSAGATVIRGEAGGEGSGAPAFELPRGGTLLSLRAEGGNGGTSTIPGIPVSFGQSGGAGIQYTSEAPGQTTLKLDGVVAIGGNVGSGIPSGSGGDGLRAASGPGAVALAATDSIFAGALSPGFGGSAGLEVTGSSASAAVEGSRLGRGTTSGFETGIGVFAGADASVNLSTIGSGAGAAVFAGRLSIRRSQVHGAVQGVLASSPGPGPEAELEIVDSLVTATEPSLGVGAAVIQSNAGGGVASLTARGTTFVAQGGTAAVWVREEEGAGSATASLRNSIARHIPVPGESAADLLADRGTIEADFSSFTDRAQENGGSAPAPASASNVAGDPEFVDPGEDYRLQGGSALIDRGDPAAVDSPGQLDLAGAARSLDGNGDCLPVPDIGAFELTGQSAPCPVPASPSELADARPSVSSFGMTNRAFAPSGRGGAGASAKRRRVKRGTRFTYVLSEAARVTIAIERKTRGRKVRRRGKARCVKQTRGNRDARRCARYVRATKPLVAQEPAGRQATPFSGRVGRRALKPGRYRARIVATDAAGQSSQPHQILFRILRG